MSTLTKIFIVVLFVLVLLMSPVFINMAVVPANYRQAFEDEKARADLAEVQASYTEMVRQVAVVLLYMLKQQTTNIFETRKDGALESG